MTVGTQLSSTGHAALSTWVSGLKAWWTRPGLWWALAWRYAGAAWLLLASLGFLVLFDRLRGIVVVSGFIGLFLLAGWCGSEVLRLSDRRVHKPMNGRILACVLLAALGLLGFGVLSLSTGKLDFGFSAGFLFFMAGFGSFLPSEIHGGIVILFDSLFMSEDFLVTAMTQTLGLTLMFLAWSGGLMRRSITSGSRTLILLAVLLVIFNVSWASAGTSSPRISLRLIVSAIGVGIGLFGFWCRRQPSFWKVLIFAWLVFAWAWIAPAAPFFPSDQAGKPELAASAEDYSEFCTKDSQAWNVLHLLEEQYVKAGVKVSPKSNLIKDLDFDGLDFVEFIMAVEEDFDLEVPDEIAETLITAGDWCGYVTKQKIERSDEHLRAPTAQEQPKQESPNSAPPADG